MDILALFQCLGPHVTATTLRQCSRITRALLVMTGRITMRGLAPLAGPAGSYRTVQRFFWFCRKVSFSRVLASVSH